MESNKQVLDRREALARLGMLVGGVVSAPVAGAILSGCGNQSTAVWHPETLRDDQNRLVITLTELIIPETDTPGAAAANVNHFVDRILSDWYTEEEKLRFLDGLSGTEDLAMQDYGRPFVDLEKQQQITILENMEKEVSEADTEPRFFSMLKELTLVGYYTSEIGATQELRYIAVPGKYDSCVPFEQIGRTWA